MWRSDTWLWGSLMNQYIVQLWQVQVPLLHTSTQHPGTPLLVTILTRPSRISTASNKCWDETWLWGSRASGSKYTTMHGTGDQHVSNKCVIAKVDWRMFLYIRYIYVLCVNTHVMVWCNGKHSLCCLVTKICKWSTWSRAGRGANRLCCYNRQQTSCIPETCTHTSFTVQVCAVHLQSMHAQLLYSFPPTSGMVSSAVILVVWDFQCCILTQHIWEVWQGILFNFPEALQYADCRSQVPHSRKFGEVLNLAIWRSRKKL